MISDNDLIIVISKACQQGMKIVIRLYYVYGWQLWGTMSNYDTIIILSLFFFFELFLSIYKTEEG